MTKEIKTAHYTNFGARIQPRCADGLGYLHYRKDFWELPEDEWTAAERYIYNAEQAIARWNEQRS